MSIDRPDDAAAAALALSFVAMLAAVTVTDLERRVIPNRVLAAGAILCFGIVALADPETLPERLGAAASAGGFLLVAAWWDRSGMGMGDVKLATVMGLYLGAAVAVALLVGLLAGAAVGVGMIIRHGLVARTRGLPFAPFLAAGGVVSLAVGDPMIEWYLDLVLR